jgi:hypothetical protein
VNAAATRLRVVASASDMFAAMLSNLARKHGWIVEHLTHTEAAADTTIEITKNRVFVSPEAALFLRPCLEPPPADPDERFLMEERVALLWAAAALSPGPVLSRPSRHGLWGLGTASARVTEHRAGQPSRRPEVFCTDSMRGEWLGTWAAEDSDGVMAAWPGVNVRPFRARPITLGEQYEAVTVVGTNAWRRSNETLDHVTLEEKSRSISKRLSLDFTVVWWAISPEKDRATFVRVTAVPSLSDIERHWPEVGFALLSLLS